MKITLIFWKTYTPRKKGNFSADMQVFKVNNRNTKARCEIRSKLTIKTLE